MAFNEKDYQAAYDVALDALERIEQAEIDEMSGLSGMLTACMAATYAMAPDDDQARYLIDLAHRTAAETDGEAA